MKMCFELPNEQATDALANTLAHSLTSPSILTFSGELGAGKTALVRSMLRALGVTSTIKSPTFSVVESYQLADYSVHHFDLYRMSDETELEAIGVRDYFSSDAVCCVEWPERAPYLLAQVDVSFVFKFNLDHDGRTLIATASSERGRALLTCLGRAQG
ncbi:MAG: tRNA (adenosine(37)-N6)-threonylcarbamoyltransferase complex ATPase subunit type 1 TsaE [Legionellaceae bacterium]|nr:tRNA (adenosine(37)-N6)-threonylcarbamoyltransferase complex ATPase subunit type 1 TsaE [Legionellaceae bacterium]